MVTLHFSFFKNSEATLEVFIIHTLGPIMQPNAIDLLTLLVCTRHKGDFPPLQTRATTLAPGETGHVANDSLLGAILLIQKGLAPLTVNSWCCYFDVPQVRRPQGTAT